MGTDCVEVELQAFNDRRLTRAVAAVCERVNAVRPHLPDGRQVHLHLHGQVSLPAKGSPWGVASARVVIAPATCPHWQRSPLRSV